MRAVALLVPRLLHACWEHGLQRGLQRLQGALGPTFRPQHERGAARVLQDLEGLEADLEVAVHAQHRFGGHRRLGELLLGHEAIQNVDVRHPPKEAAIESLAYGVDSLPFGLRRKQGEGAGVHGRAAAFLFRREEGGDDAEVVGGVHAFPKKRRRLCRPTGWGEDAVDPPGQRVHRELRSQTVPLWVESVAAQAIPVERGPRVHKPSHLRDRRLDAIDAGFVEIATDEDIDLRDVLRQRGPQELGLGPALGGVVDHALASAVGCQVHVGDDDRLPKHLDLRHQGPLRGVFAEAHGKRVGDRVPAQDRELASVVVRAREAHGSVQRVDDRRSNLQAVPRREGEAAAVGAPAAGATRSAGAGHHLNGHRRWHRRASVTEGIRSRGAWA
mmetsp:Transcript_42760/g.129174  ORF Transcript_42760/g.129174 Transcript_42760/m.129174 type:complete len:386 (-) Transcript_42760:544-1701(-)